MSKDDHDHDDQNLPATIDNDDGFSPVDQTDRVIVGTQLKFVDGTWSEFGLKIPAGTKLLAMAVNKIIQRWSGGRCIETITKKPLPDVKELNEKIPKKEWEINPNSGEPQPPYELVFVTYLLNEATAEKYTYANKTVGTRIAVEALQDRVVWMRRIRCDNVFPEVELGAKPFKTKHGTKQRPEFKILGWKQLGGEGTQPIKEITPPTTKEDLDDDLAF